MLESDLLIVSADLDSIGDELGSLLLGHRGHVFQQDSDLNRETEICRAHASVCDTLISLMPLSVSILICKQVH